MRQTAPVNKLMGINPTNGRGFEKVRMVWAGLGSVPTGTTIYTCPTGMKAIVYGMGLYNTSSVGPVGYIGYFVPSGQVAGVNYVHVNQTLATTGAAAAAYTLQNVAALLNAGDKIVGSGGSAVNAGYQVYEVPASAPLRGFSGQIPISGAAVTVMSTAGGGGRSDMLHDYGTGMTGWGFNQDISVSADMRSGLNVNGTLFLLSRNTIAPLASTPFNFPYMIASTPAGATTMSVYMAIGVGPTSPFNYWTVAQDWDY